jgi:DNA-binding response OmpR family regulator
MQGLEMFYDNLPDLVILDIMIPVMDGWEVCKVPVICIVSVSAST